jgi:hypothetical protein
MRRPKLDPGPAGAPSGPPGSKSRAPGFVRKTGLGLLSVLLFLLCFVVSDRLLFTGLRALSLRSFRTLEAQGTLGLERKAVYGRGKSDLLYFGTSRARHALNLPLISARLRMRVIREAEIGHFPRYAYYFYERYRRERRKPAVAVYGMDYFMFEKRTLPRDLAQLGIRIDDESLNPRTAANPSNPLLSRLSWLFRLKPEIDTLLNQAMDFGSKPRPDDEEGPNPTPRWAPAMRKRRSSDEDRGPAGVRPASFSRRPYRSFPGDEGRYLARLLVRLEQDGIPVFLLLIPDYVATNETNFEQDKFKADVRRIAARHANVRVLDFNTPLRFDLDKRAYFLDGEWGRSNCHLSPEGTAELTRRFLPELERSLLALRKARTSQPRQ